MTMQDIIKLAQQCGDWDGQTAEFNDVGLARFAALVAEQERQRCADIADSHASIEGIAQRIAAEIRGRA